MILSYLKVIGNPIVDLRSQLKLGKISDIVLDNENFKVAAFAIHEGGIFSKNFKVVLGEEVVQILKDGLIINDESEIISVNDVARIEALVNKKSYGINQEVVTKSGKKIGKVYDFFVDSATLSITKFCVKNIFSDRLISPRLIKEFDGRTITINDEYESIALPVTAEITA